MRPHLNYELNPPKILEDGRPAEVEEGFAKLMARIRRLRGQVSGLELTDSSLGEPRLLSVTIASKIKQILQDEFDIICNIRTRDHNTNGVLQLIEGARFGGVRGVLLLRGDHPRFGPSVDHAGAASILNTVRELGLGRGLKFYLAASVPADLENIRRKLEGKPDGFITQPVPSLESVLSLRDFLRSSGTELIVSVLVPSRRNLKAAEVSGNLDWSHYEPDPASFIAGIARQVSGVLVTSPNDFEQGLITVKTVQKKWKLKEALLQGSSLDRRS